MLNEGAELSGDTLVGLNKRRSAGGVCSAQQRLLMGFQTTAEGKSRELQSQASWGGCRTANKGLAGGLGFGGAWAVCCKRASVKAPCHC